jgi:hypothetical protein
MSQASSSSTSALDMGSGDTYVINPPTAPAPSGRNWLLIGAVVVAVAVVVFILIKRRK